MTRPYPATRAARTRKPSRRPVNGPVITTLEAAATPLDLGRQMHHTLVPDHLLCQRPACASALPQGPARSFAETGEATVLARVSEATNDHDALLARLADAERRLAALEARPAQARLFALPSARPKPVPVNHGAVVARKAEQRTKAIAAIAEGHGSSIRQLALFLNLSWYTAHAIVAKLVKDGTVTAEQDVANHNAIALRVVA